MWVIAIDPPKHRHGLTMPDGDISRADHLPLSDFHFFGYLLP